MRLLLQQRPLAGEIHPKYVQLILQQDLLGGWSLLREAGQIGGKASLKREQFLEQDAALRAYREPNALTTLTTTSATRDHVTGSQ